MVALGCGTNDFNAGVTAATTIANIQAWVTAVQSAAPLSKIWVMTVPDRGVMSNPGGYTWKAMVNAAIRALAGGNVSVMDLAGTHLDCDGCAFDPMYFNADTVHFSGTNGVPPDANINGITEQAGVAISVMTAQGIQ